MARLYLHAVLCAFLVSWGINLTITSHSLATAGMAFMLTVFVARCFPGFIASRCAELEEKDNVRR